MAATPFSLGGQRGWAHDEGHRSGTFHTYDHFEVGGRFPARKVHVWLPRRYATGSERYPVLWMFDGNTAFWRGGVAHQTWDVAAALDAVAGRPLIVVAIHPVQRDAEYTHADWAHGQRAWGRLPEHTTWLAQDVRGWVAAHYRTLSAPADHAVLGSSHGGLAAFWTATRRPDLFGVAGCLSPSFFTGLDSLRHGAQPGALRQARLVAEVQPLLEDPARRPRLWISWGARRDGGEHNAVVERLAALRGQEMLGILEAAGYRHQRVPHGAAPTPGAELYSHVHPTGGHDELTWGEQLRGFLRAFFG